MANKPGLTRRGALSSLGTLLAGCGAPRSPDAPGSVCGAARVGVTTSAADAGRPGESAEAPGVPEGITLQTDPLETTLEREPEVSRLIAVTSISRDGRQHVGRLLAQPRAPLARRDVDKVAALRTSTIELLGNPDGSPVGGYRVVRRFRFPTTDIPMTFIWTVFGFAGRPYLVLKTTLRNDSTRPVRPDHDEGNRREGITMLQGCGLDPADGSSGPVRFTIRGERPRQFGRTPVFAVLGPAHMATVYDDERGATFGYLRGATAPNIWVIKECSLVFLVNGTVVEGGERLQYYLFVGLHGGGTDGSKRGRELFEEATGLV